MQTTGLGAEFGLPVGNAVREKLRKLQLPAAFPSQAVATAYLEPTVDPSQEQFSWAVPNLVSVRDFARERFGWDREKVERLLVPVVRALQQGSSSQTTLDRFVTSHRLTLPDKGLVSTSKRVGEALRKVKGLKPPGHPKLIKTTRKKKPSKSKASKDQTVKETVSVPLPKPEAATSGSQDCDLSLISRSCGLVVAPSKDDLTLQTRERERRAKEAREKAVEIFQKSQRTKQTRLRKKFPRPRRVELESHGLSESESD